MNVNRLIVLVTFTLACLTGIQFVRGEIRLVYTPKQLAPTSDLIVLGRETPDGAIRIERFLKGQWEHKTITPGGLSSLGKTGPLISPKNRLKLSGQVVAFIDLRHGARIVANGLYRVGSVDGRPGVFGYRQPFRPGGYHLDPKPEFADLKSLLRETGDGIKAIPAMQKTLLKRIRDADRDDINLRQSLAQVVRRGDMDVIAAVARLPVTKTRPIHWFLGFYEDVQEPSAWPFVAQLYDETGESDCLSTLGRLGHPDSIAYLRKVGGRKLEALNGLILLYEALVKAKDHENAMLTARAVFDLAPREHMKENYFEDSLPIVLRYRLECGDELVSRQLPFHYFAGKHVTDAYASDALKKLTFIKKVTFYDTRVTEQGLAGLAGLTDLEELAFDRATDAALKPLAGLTKLRLLHLANTSITSAGLAHLSMLKTLEELNLYKTKVDSISPLKNLKHVRKLSLGATPVTDAGISDLSALQNLRHLGLSRTTIGDDGIKHLQTLKRLSILGLSDTRVGDAGLKVVSQLKELQYLHLSNTQITDDGLVHLRDLKELKWVTLRGTKASAAGIRQLKVALPNVRVN